MKLKERCYQVKAGKDGDALVLTALAELVLEVKVFLGYMDENVEVDIAEWKGDGTADERRVARLSVVADIMSDEIIDSAVRFGALQARVVATRIDGV